MVPEYLSLLAFVEQAVAFYLGSAQAGFPELSIRLLPMEHI